MVPYCLQYRNPIWYNNYINNMPYFFNKKRNDATNSTTFFCNFYDGYKPVQRTSCDVSNEFLLIMGDNFVLDMLIKQIRLERKLNKNKNKK